MAKESKRTAARRATEFRFSIEAYTPATIPMARLAEYMAQVVEILGEPASVHFSRLEAGSTQVVSIVEREAVPKVRQRALSVVRGDAPRDAMRAHAKLNQLLRDDDARGTLKEGKKATLIAFPGREATGEAFRAVRQHGTVEGEVVRVGGTGEDAMILIRFDQDRVVSCRGSRVFAKAIAADLFEHVRLHGEGRWSRSVDGIWSLDDFHVTSHEVLDRGSLGAALKRVRGSGVSFVRESTEDAGEGPGEGGGRHGQHASAG